MNILHQIAKFSWVYVIWDLGLGVCFLNFCNVVFFSGFFLVEVGDEGVSQIAWGFTPILIIKKFKNSKGD